VIDLDDVDVVRVEFAHDAEQRAGPVLQHDLQPREAARTREVAQQHIGQQASVDIAATQHQPDCLARELFRVGQHCGKTRSSCAFDHRLLDLQ